MAWYSCHSGSADNPLCVDNSEADNPGVGTADFSNATKIGIGMLARTGSLMKTLKQ